MSETESNIISSSAHRSAVNYETQTPINTLYASISAQALSVVQSGAENAKGSATIVDRVFFIKCNLAIREILHKYWEVKFADATYVERAYTILQSYAGNSEGDRYESFRRNFINIIEVNENTVEEDDIINLFKIFEKGRVQINISKSIENIQVLTTVINELAPDECKENVFLKQVQALYYWYQDHKSDPYYIKRKLETVFEILFNFKPSHTGKIYLALSGSTNSFVHEAFKDSLIFGHEIDLEQCWKLYSDHGLEKLQGHYRTALDFFIYLYRFDSTNTEDITKLDYQFGLSKLLALFPEASGIMIPNQAEYKDKQLVSHSHVEIFTESIDPNLLVFDILDADEEFIVSKLYHNLEFVFKNKFLSSVGSMTAFVKRLICEYFVKLEIREASLEQHLELVTDSLTKLILNINKQDPYGFKQSLQRLRFELANINSQGLEIQRPLACPSQFRPRGTKESLEILKLLQKGILRVKSTINGNRLVYNNKHELPAPANNQDWNTVVFSKFMLELMYLDNSFMGRYNYYNLNKLRDQFISDYTTPWEYNGQEFAFEIEQNTGELCVLSCNLRIEGHDELIPIKMYIPAIKDKISLIRKLISKGVALNKVLDLMRIRIEVPEFLLQNDELRNKVFACLTGFLMSRQGNSLYEPPKDTHNTSQNAFNPYSSSAWSMFKIVLRQNGEVSDETCDKIRSIAEDVQVSVLTIDKSFNDLIQLEYKMLSENISKATELPESMQQEWIKHFQEQTQTRISSYMQSNAYLNGIKECVSQIISESNYGQAVDSTFEVQMIAGKAVDDHNTYEWKQVLSILKLKLPYYYRALKLCLNLQLFSDIDNCDDVMRPLYIWSLKTVIQALLDPEIFTQLMDDSQVDNRIVAYVLDKVCSNDNEKSALGEVLTIEAKDKLKFMHEEMSHYDMDASMV